MDEMEITAQPVYAPETREQQAIRLLREALTDEVIRGASALRQQRNVCRAQGDDVAFVTGVEAARDYLVGTFAEALRTAGAGQ